MTHTSYNLFSHIGTKEHVRAMSLATSVTYSLLMNNIAPYVFFASIWIEVPIFKDKINKGKLTVEYNHTKEELMDLFRINF